MSLSDFSPPTSVTQPTDHNVVQLQLVNTSLRFPSPTLTPSPQNLSASTIISFHLDTLIIVHPTLSWVPFKGLSSHCH